MKATQTLDPEVVIKMIEETPNDLELGSKIRMYYYETKEA